MLKSWFVENFKSANGKVELQFAPLTIFCGANSSGKSTFLQSILLAKQTFEYSHQGRPLALNGPILKLGRFGDVKHVNSAQSFIGLGGTFDARTEPLATERYRFVSAHGYAGYTEYLTEQVRTTFSSVSFETKLDVLGKDDSSQVQPDLVYGAVFGKRLPSNSETSENEDIESGSRLDEESDTFLILSRHDTSSAASATDRAGSSRDFSDGKRYKVLDSDISTEAEVLEDRPAATIIGGSVDHFLPAGLIVDFDANSLRANKIAEALCALQFPLRARLRDIENQKISHTIVEMMIRHLGEAGFSIQQPLIFFDNAKEDSLSISEAITLIQEKAQPPAPERGQTFGLSVNTLRSSPSSKQAYKVALQDIQPVIANKISEELGPRQEVQHRGGREVSKITEYIDNFFSRSVHYLGPLRDEPKPLYPLEALSNPLDVGYKGEHTAAVFELNKNQRISYLPPSTLKDWKTPTYLSKNSLHDATVDWLSYLGVAEDIRTSDLGKFGHEMQVITGGLAKSHDLTNVGVGVSQILPIVVMALLAPERSLLIFEQPELHLHPKVQSRLADFFMSLSLQGKQCLVETHSEYLVQRIRRRIAESVGATMRDQTQIYFVEREEGQSKYTPIQISEYGAILNWPQDFFDQGDKEIEKIIEASSRKQALNKKNKQN